MKSDGTSSTEITETDGIDVVFRPQKSIRNEAIFNLIFFSLLGIGSTFFMWFAAHPSQKLNAVLGFSVMWSLIAGVFIWEILVCQFTSITIRNGTVILQSVFSCKELDLSNVTQARWKLISHGALSLETPTEKGTFGLINLTREERLWLIQYFRSCLPESIQQNWDLFCLKKALPLRKRKPEVIRDPGPDEILVTRERYDRIGIPLTILSIICAALTAWYLRSPRYLVLPVILIGLWLSLRYSTPKHGTVAQRINVDKEFMQVLKFLGWWSGAGLIVFIAFVLADLTQSIYTTLGWCLTYLWLSALCWKIYQSHRDQHKQDLNKAKEAVQKWDIEIDPQAEG